MSNPIFSEIILTTSDGKTIKVFSEEEINKRLKERFWLNLMVWVNLVSLGFVVGFACCYFNLPNFLLKNFW